MLVKVLLCVSPSSWPHFFFKLSRTFSRTPQKPLDLNLIIYMYTWIGTYVCINTEPQFGIYTIISFTRVYKNLLYNRQNAEAIFLICTVSILFIRTDCKGFHHFIKVHQLPVKIGRKNEHEKEKQLINLKGDFISIWT